MSFERNLQFFWHSQNWFGKCDDLSEVKMSSPKRQPSSTLRCPTGMSHRQSDTISTFRYKEIAFHNLNSVNPLSYRMRHKFCDQLNMARALSNCITKNLKMLQYHFFLYVNQKLGACFLVLSIVFSILRCSWNYIISIENMSLKIIRKFSNLR